MTETTQGTAGGAVADAAPELDRAEAIVLYRRMVLIRRFEDEVQSLFEQGRIHGTTHLYSGQEASAVGVCSVLSGADRVAATYRGHGAALALEVPTQGLMDELLGRATGTCGGRAGSMNVVDLEHRLIGCFGIVGGTIGAATGVALGLNRSGSDGVAVAFFGDGTSNQAYFHECLNFAQVLRLPVVFVCENNRYMEFTAIEDVTAGEITARPEAMGIPVRSIDGNDLWAVRGAAAEALDHARSGAGPAFVETLTYRYGGHSRSDPGNYRKPGELDAWRKRDPLLIARRALTERYGTSEGELGGIDDEVRAEIAEVVNAGLAAALPDPEGPARAYCPGPGEGDAPSGAGGAAAGASAAAGSGTPARTLTMRAAVKEALDEELGRDESVVFFGEDVAVAGGVFAVTPGLREAHGPERVFDTPISELAMTGAAFGSAVAGLRPVIEIMFGDFLPLAMDSLVNQAAKYWYVSNEQANVPLVVRSAVGGGGRFGAIHSQMPISWFHGIAGLKIVAPASAGEAKALLKGAIRDPNPVLFLEHKRLYSVEGPESKEAVIEPGRATVVRSGADITLVSAAKGVRDCLDAAEQLAGRGIDAEVVDLRSLQPLDTETVLASLAQTNRIAIVEEGAELGGWAANLLGIVTDRALHDLDDAWTITTPAIPIPYSPPLEDAHFPNADSIASDVSRRIGVQGP